MSATTPFVGVRIFSNLSDNIVAIDARDSTVIGMCLPLPNVAAGDQPLFPLDQPIMTSTPEIKF